MPIQGRVGRHVNTGINCQNWVADQMWVIGLLNLIPLADGGTSGSLDGDHVVAGTASDPLYKAILGFQKKYYPAQVSGFVEPGGPVLTRMETLASRAGSSPPATNSAGQWGEFQSGSVQRALYKALSNDSKLSQVTVVDILYATLDNGTLSGSEIADLKMIAEKSKSITDRSKKMLLSFVDQATSTRLKLGGYRLPSDQHIRSAEFVCQFLKRIGRGQWPNFDRDDVGVSILMRLAYPSLLQQGNANLCGPAAFLYQLLRDYPGSYALYAITMYEKGTARLREMEISPSKSLRDANPWGVDPVDWLTMGSLRDSNNWFLTFDSTDDTLAGATTMYELAEWFTLAGYSDVQEDADLIRHQRDTGNMDKASQLLSDGYRVCLLIDDQMVKKDEQTKSGSMVLKDRHWVVLRSKIDRSGGTVKFVVYTWGEQDHQVPQSGTLTLSDFLENYYGYVAAMP